MAKQKYKEVEKRIEYLTYGGKIGRRAVKEITEEEINGKKYKVVYLIDGTVEPCSEEELRARIKKHYKIVKRKVKVEKTPKNN